VFAQTLASAMLAFVDDEFRQGRAADALGLGESFSIAQVAKEYVDLFEKLWA
jgi:hypothetical protein